MSENSHVRVFTSQAANTPTVSPPGKRKSLAGRALSASIRPGFSDRLLRNTAIACALLLGILALDHVNLPWARKASANIERALTMRINLDDSIGDLQFVRQFMPKSTLVFLNVSDQSRAKLPVSGEIEHPWSAVQPWMVYDCEEEESALCVADGTVTAVSPLSSGLFGVLVDHGGGRESVYANLAEVSVNSGDKVPAGGALGACDDKLYFEYRVDGESVDPSEVLKAR